MSILIALPAPKAERDAYAKTLAAYNEARAQLLAAMRQTTIAEVYLSQPGASDTDTDTEYEDRWNEAEFRIHDENGNAHPIAWVDEQEGPDGPFYEVWTYDHRGNETVVGYYDAKAPVYYVPLA
jgi:hypothetical protein